MSVGLTTEQDKVADLPDCIESPTALSESGDNNLNIRQPEIVYSQIERVGGVVAFYLVSNA